MFNHLLNPQQCYEETASPSDFMLEAVEHLTTSTLHFALTHIKMRSAKVDFKKDFPTKTAKHASMQPTRHLFGNQDLNQICFGSLSFLQAEHPRINVSQK